MFSRSQPSFYQTRRICARIAAPAVAAVILILPPAVAAPANSVNIVGWPTPDFSAERPALELGDDPVLGRQLCPPLTRLNLAGGKSEDVLLKKIVEGRAPVLTWRLELRAGLHWWDGAPVSAVDVAKFVEAALPGLVEQRGNGLWKLPWHTITADTNNLIFVSWKETPAFGAYVLNGAPLWRVAEKAAANEPHFQCAGVYRPVSRDGAWSLSPNPGYSFNPPLGEIALGGQNAKVPPARRLEFRFAASLGGTPEVRANDEPGASCQNLFELPAATLIAWNTKKAPASDPNLRALMTQMTPRGALVRSVAATLGELISAPISRHHPGYNAQVLVRPFDLDGAAKGLEKLGYVRKTPTGPRLDLAGKPLALKIKAESGSSSLAGKVVVDAFAAVGIDVDFVDEQDPVDADGFLAAVSLDWPRNDLLANFHSKAAHPEPFWPLQDKELDHLLERYAVTLTTAKPDFSILAAIHKKLFDLEPATVILQHKACFNPGAVRGKKTAINTRDPDWFRQILM